MKTEKEISTHLEKIFCFPIPTIIRTPEVIYNVLEHEPFIYTERTKEIRLYVSFLKKNSDADLEFPWISPNHSFKIIGKIEQTVLSVLDLSISKSPKAMASLELHYGKEITTRNWNTIELIGHKLPRRSN
ncbi:MAG: hypothetical protein ACI9Q4_001370 [Sediminicola sp.]|jgi:uncharacterized protein (DUF1697 family)